MGNSSPLLSVSLRVDYPNKPCALKAVSFEIYPGEVLGLIGESGSGKSTIALAILRLLDSKGGRAEGQIQFRERDLMAATEREMRSIRGCQMSLILQSPTSSLNPALRIGTQLAEAWKSHASGSRSVMEEAVKGVLNSVGLPTNPEFRSRYPSQISVGQAQRVLIAMAVMHSPALLIADEPTSALDAITQWEIMKLFSALNRKIGTAVLYISHDLRSVASICHRIAILHEGEVVECRATRSVMTRPVHPYTRRLLACMPWLPELGMPSPVASDPLSERSGLVSDGIGIPEEASQVLPQTPTVTGDCEPRAQAVVHARSLATEPGFLARQTDGSSDAHPTKLPLPCSALDLRSLGKKPIATDSRCLKL